MRTILALILTAASTFSAYADPPSLEFRSTGIQVNGMRPGTRVVWLAMLRDRIRERPRVTMQRGLEPVTPNGELTVESGLDASQSMWIVAAVDQDVVLRQSAPGYPVSPTPIEAQVSPGTNTLRIRSGTISLTYVRRHGAGVWVFAAADGSELDSDHAPDGWISVHCCPN